MGVQLVIQAIGLIHWSRKFTLAITIHVVAKNKFMRKIKFTMWGVFGRNGGLIALFRSKWKAEAYKWQEDQTIQKVNIEIS